MYDWVTERPSLRVSEAATTPCPAGAWQLMAVCDQLRIGQPCAPTLAEPPRPKLAPWKMTVLPPTILGGRTTIGAGSVIAAGSFITQSVPPGTRVGAEAQRPRGERAREPLR